MVKCMRHKDYAIFLYEDQAIGQRMTIAKNFLFLDGLTEAEVLIVARTLVSHFPETVSGPTQELQRLLP